MKRTEQIFIGLGIVVAIFSACMPIVLVLLFNFQANMYERLDDLSTRMGRIEGRLEIPVAEADPASIVADSLQIVDRDSSNHSGDTGLIISSFGN